MKVKPHEVRAANRRFFDLASEVYEQVDGRRSEIAPDWLVKILQYLAKMAPEGPYLDIGCGTGWLIRCAADFFPDRYGSDISPVILKHALKKCHGCIASQAEALPYKTESFAVVSFFATFHHLPEWEPVIEEAQRVLKPGGWLYTDHDIDRIFLKRFRVFLSIYRRFRKAPKRYHKACPQISRELYYMSEFHENTGVSAQSLESILKRTGFNLINLEWHWLGVHPVFDIIGRIVGVRRSPGFAPNLRIIAQKST